MQVTRVALKSDRDAKFLDNTTGLITPANLRAFLDNFIDSSFNIVDDGNGAVIQTRSTTILTAAVLTANSIPVECIPAAGSGTIIKPIGVTIKLVYGSAAFATNVAFNFRFAGLSTNLVGGSSTIDKTQTGYTFELLNGINQLNSVDIENKGIVFIIPSGNPTGGSGTSLVINFQYIVLTI